MMLWSFGQVRPTILRLVMRTRSIFNSQHVATRCNRVTKRTQHVAPNNVAICCVKMLRSFGRSLQKLGQQCWDKCCVEMLLSFGRGLMNKSTLHDTLQFFLKFYSFASMFISLQCYFLHPFTINSY